MGWDFEPGYIERRYSSCADDGHPWGDLCWPGREVLVLNAGGSSHELVKVASNPDQWRFRDDDGSIVVRRSGGANPSSADGYFELNTVTGDRFLFAQGTLPGRGAQNSLLTVPVFGDDPGERAATARSRRTAGAARRTDGTSTGSPTGTATPRPTSIRRRPTTYGRQGYPSNVSRYDRGSYLSKIEYGMHADGTGSYSAPARERCWSRRWGAAGR